jgi:hypothetical protein
MAECTLAWRDNGGSQVLSLCLICGFAEPTPMSAYGTSAPFSAALAMSAKHPKSGRADVQINVSYGHDLVHHSAATELSGINKPVKCFLTT